LIEVKRSQAAVLEDEDHPKTTLQVEDTKQFPSDQPLPVVSNHCQGPVSIGSPVASTSRDFSQATNQLLNFTNGMTFINAEELDTLKQKGLELERTKDQIKQSKSKGELMSQIARLFSAKENMITKQRKEMQELSSKLKDAEEKYEQEKQENLVLRQELGKERRNLKVFDCF
jgi:glucosamine 6-phosphate synthetase-like amidotransferase/phosphosugar isomerase protein